MSLTVIALQLCAAVLCLAILTHQAALEKEFTNFNSSNEAKDERVTYVGNQVWKVCVENEEKKGIIRFLAQQSDISTWGGNTTNVDILVNPLRLEDVKRTLRENTIGYEVMIEDLQKAIDEENPPPEADIDELQDRKGHPLNWISYHNAANIYSFLDYVEASFPNICKVVKIGNSVEGRPLLVVKISNGNPKNKRIWIDGGIHAREWISPAVTTYIINHLTENFENLDPAIQNTDWHILALANPDGYEFTHNKNRLWRKNRAKGGLCRGVDLNRNFGYAWGGKGTSNNPCEEIFRGPNAFSEPESKAMRDYIIDAGFKAYVSFHSYGQYILYPWGYDVILTEDHAQLQDVGEKMAMAMKLSNPDRTNYRVGTSAKLLYPASGGSDDWAKAAARVKYAYTVELRDTGRYGFVLPAWLIKPTAEEAWATVNVLAKVNSEY